MSTEEADHELARDHGAPTLYFDFAPVSGFRDGVVHITLSMAQHYPASSKVATDRVVVAHLRTSVRGLGELKRAVDGALLLATPAHGQAGRENAN
jgi:hypothetical protein